MTGVQTCALPICFPVTIKVVLMADHNVPIWIAIPIGLLSATLMGAVNGALVVLTQLNGFIITLGTYTILLGFPVTIGVYLYHR